MLSEICILIIRRKSNIYIYDNDDDNNDDDHDDDDVDDYDADDDIRYWYILSIIYTRMNQFST